MRQILSNTLPPTVVRTREGTHVAPNPSKYSKALIVTIIGFASPLIVAIYLVQELPAIAVLSSLVRGFAPLLGLGLLLILVAFLTSFLIDTAERIFVDDDDNTAPEHHRKSKWVRVTDFLSDTLVHSLSLREHSPPAMYLS